MKVIGAGLGRTGTNSLKLALEQLLEAPTYHMFEVAKHPAHVPVWHDASLGRSVDWDALFEGFEAAVDWPVCAFAVELSRAYPESLILLSTRDFDSWWKSASSTIFDRIDVAEGPWGEMVRTLLAETFTSQVKDQDASRKAFERHHETIRREIPKDRILEWRAGDGWEPICERLGLPVPAEPFPHTNTTKEFKERGRAASK